ncbi:BrnT family toxin [Mycoplana ramosa]|uniref:BrnT family toxin n=1 Tax=Mycoplana ramosa TaxID=40837 RepID=A0ABW3YW82_MYCRA
MRIVYDERKRRANIAKHGYDFAELTLEFFAGSIAVAAKHGRWKAIGPFGERLVAIVFVPLGSQGVSVISMRPASRQERALYAKQ